MLCGAAAARHKYRKLLCAVEVWPSGGEWRLQLSKDDGAEGGGALLCETELLLQGLWHLRGRRAGQAEVHLHRVIDEPLQSGQSTNHDDTGDQTLPDT